MVNFAAGGVATPADAALMMQMGVDGVFVGSGIFKSGDPSARARAIVQVRAASALFCAASLAVAVSAVSAVLAELKAAAEHHLRRP